MKNRRKGSRRRIRSDKEVRLCKFENNSHCFFQVLTQIDKVHNPKCLQHIFHDTWTAFGHRDKSWFIWCGCLNKQCVYMQLSRRRRANNHCKYISSIFILKIPIAAQESCDEDKTFKSCYQKMLIVEIDISRDLVQSKQGPFYHGFFRF